MATVLKIARAVLVVCALAGVVGGAVYLATPEAQAKKPGGGGPPGGCVCPMVYAPVECDGGHVYSNQCVADCHHATGCVPIGPGPIPL